MTHDELLAKIDDNLSNCGDDCDGCLRDNAPWFALRAVVELHKPVEIDRELNYNCQECEWGYPCPTIQAIEKDVG